MGFTLGAIFKVVILLLNAVAILNERVLVKCLSDPLVWVEVALRAHALGPFSSPSTQPQVTVWCAHA